MSWCMSCHKSYPVGLEICPDCGDLLESGAPPEGCSGNCESCGLHCEEESCTGDCDPGLWPLDDLGEPVPPALLMTVTGTQLDYQMVQTQLQSYGVPVLGSFSANGALAKLILGFAGSGMDVMVPENMVDLARELMKPLDDGEEQA